MNSEATYEQSAQRMHPLWMLFSIVKSIKELVLLVIFLMVYIGSNSDSIYIKIGGIIAIIYIIYKIISVLFEWFHFKYLFTDIEMHIREGRFIKKSRFIPLDRIQGISRNTHFIHHLFGLTSLILETGASGDDSFVKLEMITKKEADRIQNYLNKVDLLVIDLSQEDIQQEENIETKIEPRQKHYKMTLKEIYISSLMSLKLLMIIPLFETIYSNTNSFLSIQKYVDNLISFFHQSWIMTVLGIIILLIISMGYGLLKTYIQYGNFEVTSDDYRIFIKKGIFNQNEISVPKSKIQAVRFNAGMLRRWIGLVEVKIISTNELKDTEEKTANVLFPFLSKKRALILVSEILPEFNFTTEINTLPLNSMFVKLLRHSYIWIGTGLAIYYLWPHLWYVSIVVFIIVILSNILSTIYSGYSVNGPFIQIQKGNLNKSLFVTNRTNIEEVRIKESFVQRIFGLASLRISTRAKPIQVTKIADIPKDIAISYYHWYANRKN
ncbi:putative membrane protein [Priestia aryabhattai]|uniref:PH domain-containing protein n=1 Tax=Priestia aryabhattai TaxID=412384 RepID=UPI0027E58DA1|nr:PH domain-containing protein [Priestia aryabhattai]MDP9726520.1 putative membrane protein [Priestia aryabhattai]